MPDKIIFYIVIILMTIGVIFSYSLTPFLMVRYSAGELNFVLKQAIFEIMSVLIIWVLARLEPDKWIHRIGMTLFFGGLFLMIIMNFLPSSIVPTIGGASRWISIFGFSLAPVEFFKIGFIYFISWSMARKVRDDGQNIDQQEFIIFFPYLLVFVMSVFLITVMQKDLGQSVILGGTLIVITYLAGGSGRFISKIIGGLMVLFLIFIISFSHRTERIQSWWQLAKNWFPDWVTDIIGVSHGSEPYQVAQALGSIYNGGFWGTGLGNGIFKYGLLAEAHTDFILEGIAEELGLLSIAVIFFLFAYLFKQLLRVANRSKNRVYLLFNIGIALIIMLALLINTYGSTGLIPMKGIPVPFISYGGSSMLALAFGIGMALMTSKEIIKDAEQPTAETIPDELRNDISTHSKKNNYWNQPEPSETHFQPPHQQPTNFHRPERNQQEF